MSSFINFLIIYPFFYNQTKLEILTNLMGYLNELLFTVPYRSDGPKCFRSLQMAQYK